MSKPVVAVTFGDASGIGPELVAKLLSRPEVLAAANIVLVGDSWVWAEGQRIAGVTPPVRIIRGWDEARNGDGTPMFLELSTVAKADIVPAQATAAAGAGARLALTECLEAVKRGQADAINKGFAHTRGDILSYLNSDDTLLPGAVDEVVNHFLAHPDCDLVYGKAHVTDEDDRILGDYKTADYSFQRLLEDCCICQPAAFWRQAIAQRVGLFDESLHLSMDYDYWMRIDRAGGCIEHIHDYLACSRMHAATKTLTQQTEVFDEIIRVSMRNAGFASLVYYQGFWHYRCYHKSRWRWLWRRVPCLPQVLGRLHHRWDNRATYSNRAFLRDAAKALKKRFGNRLGPILTLTKPITQFLTRQRARRLLTVAKPRVVDGVWSDNWVGATCVVRLKDSPVGEHLQLTGIANEPMELTVAVQDKPIGVFPLRGQQLEDIQFQVEPGSRRQLKLSFSKHMVDAAGRRLSFRLQGTNLFSEQDLAA